MLLLLNKYISMAFHAVPKDQIQKLVAMKSYLKIFQFFNPEHCNLTQTLKSIIL